MRIVHVSDCYAPRVGGIESQVQDLAVHQAQQGHAVHVLTATALPEDADNRYRATTTDAPGLRVHRLASPITFGLPVHPRGYTLTRRALELIRPDVVHVAAGVVSPFAFDGARAARSLGLPLAVTWHCMLDGVEPLVSLGASATGWDRAAFAPSAVSSVAAARVAAALRRDDVTVLPNGLDLAPWRAVATADRVGDARTLRVVATQRLAPRKRALPLLHAVAAAHERLGRHADGTPRIRLTLVGGGPAEAQVRGEIAARRLDDVVTMLGKVPRAVLASLYRDQDVFVAPAELEAFGIAALEARASGLVVVSRAGTGVGEFVTDGVDGVLAPSDDALAQALVRLADDRPLLARLRERSVADPPRVDWTDVLGVSDELYHRAIDAADPTAAGARRRRPGRSAR